MEVNQLFYPWVPRHLRYAILLVMTFVALCANGVYPGITTNMYSDLGVYAEPFTMATNALYIGMGAGFLFIIRFAVRFTGKWMVLTGFGMLLLMNLVCATTSNPFITVAASLVLGFSKILALGQLYLSWLMIWSKKMDAARVYPFFYFIALAGLNGTTWIASVFAYRYSWRYTYIAVTTLIVICIILTLVFVEGHKLRKKIPLYQLDLPGLLLLITSLMSINYIAVYGKVEDWFSSTGIVAATFTAVITLLLFIRRELSVKRPILDLRIFRHFNVSAGLVLFMLLGIFSPTTFQTAFTSNILHFELRRNAELSLYLIPGIAAGSILTFYWYKKNYSTTILIMIGFAAFVGYHIMMYNRFVNDLSMADFLAPSCWRGFALAVLYVAIGLYATANLSIPQGLKAVGLVLIVRSFLATGITGGLYNYFLYASTNRHLSLLASQIDANEPMIAQQSGYDQYILQQASLTAFKDISGTLILVGVLIILVMMTLAVYKKVNRSFS